MTVEFLSIIIGYVSCNLIHQFYFLFFIENYKIQFNILI